MNKLMPLLFSVLLFGCGKDSAPSKSSSPISSNSVLGSEKKFEIISEAVETVSGMNEYLSVYVKANQIDNLIIKFTDDDTQPLEGPVRGTCDKSGSTPVISLYRADWVGPYSTNDTSLKMASLYHLIGHCVFNKSHNDATSGLSTLPASFMNSNFGHHQFTGGFTLTSARLVDYQREFFNYYGPL